MGLTMNERYEINALLEDLLNNDETTFDSDKARRLIMLVPLTKSGSVLELSFKHQGNSTKGHAAGIGDVEIPGETTRKELKLGQDEVHRVGGYKLQHTKKHVHIELMWADTVEDRSGQAADLHYRTPEEPVKMTVLKVRHFCWGFRIPFTEYEWEQHFAFGTYVPWKLPR